MHRITTCLPIGMPKSDALIIKAQSERNRKESLPVVLVGGAHILAVFVEIFKIGRAAQPLFNRLCQLIDVCHLAMTIFFLFPCFFTIFTSFSMLVVSRQSSSLCTVINHYIKNVVKVAKLQSIIRVRCLAFGGGPLF